MNDDLFFTVVDTKGQKVLVNKKYIVSFTETESRVNKLVLISGETIETATIGWDYMIQEIGMMKQ